MLPKLYPISNAQNLHILTVLSFTLLGANILLKVVFHNKIPHDKNCKVFAFYR